MLWGLIPDEVSTFNIQEGHALGGPSVELYGLNMFSQFCMLKTNPIM